MAQAAQNDYRFGNTPRRSFASLNSTGRDFAKYRTVNYLVYEFRNDYRFGNTHSD